MVSEAYRTPYCPSCVAWLRRIATTQHNASQHWRPYLPQPVRSQRPHLGCAGAAARYHAPLLQAHQHTHTAPHAHIMAGVRIDGTAAFNMDGVSLQVVSSTICWLL